LDRSSAEKSDDFEGQNLNTCKKQTRSISSSSCHIDWETRRPILQKKAVRSFLAFPYGVLTLASYIKRFAKNLKWVEVLDLNLLSAESADVILKRKISDMRPDVVGFSMSYDVSYPWLKSLAEAVKNSDKSVYVVAGGPAITTAYAEVLMECEHVDAACYSEGDLAAPSHSNFHI
jgi:radical SAM superfamily enzyme YgiQ (UPF0313 family)